MESIIIKTRDEILEESIVRDSIVSKDAAYAARKESEVTGEPIGMILVKNGFISQERLIHALEQITDDALVDEMLFVAHVPNEVLINDRIMIAAQTDKKVFVATTSTEDRALYLLEPYFPKQEIVFLAANNNKIDEYLDRLLALSDDDGSMLDKLLRNAIAGGISDIHMNPRFESYSVFYRHLGVRRLVYEGTIDEYLKLTARVKDRSKMDLAERRIPQDGGFSIDYNGRLVDLRVATVPTHAGETIVIRILDPEKAQKELHQIGITRVDRWKSGTARSHGICLICGPTGSGKTTTLNATIKNMDRFGKAIFSVEDPVEYSIPYVGQVNINTGVGLDFSRAIRAFMRSDPDVIVVGEIRDAETARNAVKAAETGHLVLATLHTGSIHGAANRLRDLEVDPHELKYVLRSILAQSLVRTICTTCHGENPECPHCFGSGYSGRTIVSECEYFGSIKEVNRLIDTEDVTWPTMIDDAYSKYRQGITDREELVRVFGPAEIDLAEENYNLIQAKQNEDL